MSRGDTQRSQAEEELRRQGEWLRVTLSSIGDAVIATDAAGRITFLNPAAAALTGWQPEEALGRLVQSVFRIIDEETHAPAEDIVGRVLREGNVVNLANHMALITRGGLEIPIEDSAAPIRDSAGQVCGVVLVFHDVTEKRRAQQALRKSEAQLQTILENLTEGLVVATLDGQTVLWNRAALEIHGFSSADECRRRLPEFAEIFELSTLDGAVIPVEQWPLARILRGEHLCDLELRMRRLDTGCRRVVSYGGALVRDAQGRPLLAVVSISDISERKLAEQALRRLNSELEERVARQTEETRHERQRFNDVLEMLPAYVVLLSPDYYVRFANRFFRERFGEFRGRRCFEYLFGRDEPCEVCETYRVLKTNAPHRWEWIGPDGRNYDIFDFPFTDSDGSPLIMEVGIDITERKRADEALREAHRILEVRVEERTAELAKANAQLRAEIEERRRIEQALRESQADLNRAQAVARTGSWRLDVRRNELLWSDETHRIFEIPKGTPLTYEVFLSAVHPDDRDHVDRSWKAALRGETYDVEHRIVVGDALKWIRERAELEFGPDGALLGGFGTAQDITELKQAEERIRHQHAVVEGINRILQEALGCDTEEELGRTCLAVAEEVTRSKFGFIGEIDAEGRLEDIAISDPGWDACRMRNPTGHGEAMAKLAKKGLYASVLLTGKGFYTNDPASHPDIVGAPKGHPPLTAFLGVPLKHDGKTIGIIAVANREGGYCRRDLEALEALALSIVQVFMRKRAERAVRSSEERLRQAQKMESIGLLAGGIAHDFNNLLATIMGNASLLRDEVSQESRDKLDSVIQATEKAADLTRQLLAYAGKGRLVVEPLSFSRIIRAMTELLRASIPKKVSVKLALESGLPGVEADRGQLQQIVMNLVINAAEAIGANRTGTVTIRTRAQKVSKIDRISDEITGGLLAPGIYVCLEVEDTGCGMDQETRAKIFDPFFTTKFMGRGLGLAAVAGIVQAHHGAIQLETAPGRGATFRVFLPAGAPPERPGRSGRRPDLRGTETVLLVDDEAMVRSFVRRALERYGYKVLAAKDGREAVRIFQKNADRIGLVLLDLMMPVMGGDEAIGILKSKRSDLRVIVMSGYGESETTKMFAGKGVSGFLQKPFTAMQLVEEVKLVLTDSREKSDQL